MRTVGSSHEAGLPHRLIPVAGALALLTAITIGVTKKLTAPLAQRTILRSAIGGVAFGLVGVALPLTLFTGTDQLPTVIRDGATLGAGR